jgi:hypothetical protein
MIHRRRFVSTLAASWLGLTLGDQAEACWRRRRCNTSQLSRTAVIRNTRGTLLRRVNFYNSNGAEIVLSRCTGGVGQYHPSSWIIAETAKGPIKIHLPQLCGSFNGPPIKLQYSYWWDCSEFGMPDVREVRFYWHGAHVATAVANQGNPAEMEVVQFMYRNNQWIGYQG